MTSMFLKSYRICTRSNAPTTCPSCCQLSRLRGRTVAPRSQIAGQEQAVRSMQPWVFYSCPFPHTAVWSSCNWIISNVMFSHFQRKVFPERRVIQHWSRDESFSQCTRHVHLSTCFAWFRSGAWPWFSHILDERPSHWAIRAITSALWPY